MFYLSKFVSHIKGNQPLRILTSRESLIFEGTCKDFIERFNGEYYFYCSINEVFTLEDELIIKINQ